MFRSLVIALLSLLFLLGCAGTVVFTERVDEVNDKIIKKDKDGVFILEKMSVVQVINISESALVFAPSGRPFYIKGNLKGIAEDDVITCLVNRDGVYRYFTKGGYYKTVRAYKAINCVVDN
ncbi:hypothetical protein GUI12_01820 [Anaplasmataceae bacterium AB001_6]|nr:hypothetical protein GUI12_01820 [Anaplasmataceae bacterium AB001_6]